MSTNWRKYTKTRVNKHVLMYFLQLVLTFTPPHYIIMVKGLFPISPRFIIDFIPNHLHEVLHAERNILYEF